MSPNELYELEDGPEGRTVVVTGRWSRKAADVLRSGSADGLTLNYARGFCGNGLAFLDGLPIRRLHVVDRSIEDLEPITRLAGSLEELSIQAAPIATLDLEPLRLLRSVASEWQLMRETLRH
jgi:internalin A